jgi:ribonucleoside-triphosphate reductase
MDLLPKVFRTEGDMVDFDPTKILVSIMKETDMSEQDANHITELVTRRIISTNMKFLSGPHIREIVCSVLSEQHFEQERKYYTRIGMPLMDYEEILERGPPNLSGEIINPEKIHHWASNQIAEEYALLRILDDEESKAHLYGDIFIHDLKYFDMRPLCQSWDPRFILKYGLPPVDSWTHCCKSGPAGDLRVAINHLVKLIGITRGEFSGNQGLNLISTFLAPYAKGLADVVIKHHVQGLIYEINQLSAIIGRDIPATSISICPQVIPSLSKIPAIGPHGVINGVYGDYDYECLSIFNAITNVFKEGDFYKNPFNAPKHFIYYNDNWLSEYENSYSNIWEEVKTMKTPYLINTNSNWFENQISKLITDKKIINYGTLQHVYLNLPRFAYMSNNESDFMYLLKDMMNLCAGILTKKYDIIKKRLSTNHLPISNAVLEEGAIFELDEQKLSIGIVGLNEAVKALVNDELHDNLDSFNVGVKIVKDLKDTCEEMSKRDNKNYALNEVSSELVNIRFTRLDLKHFPTVASNLINAKRNHYTNSAHYRNNNEIKSIEDIFKLGQFHRLIQNGVIEKISLGTLARNRIEINEFIEMVSKNSDIIRVKFIE